MEDNQKIDEVTIFDVAKEAGVSYSTVSRVVNNKEYVSADKRQRVLLAMEKLGYVANVQARGLAGGKTNIIGLLVHGFDSAYIGEIIKGIDKVLYQANYDLMLYTTHRRKSKEAAYVVKLTKHAVDGMLLVLPRYAEAYLKMLKSHGIPYVLVDHEGISQNMRVPAVGAENWKGAYEATRYLIQIGHRRIGFITGTLDMACAQDRLKGYKDALCEYNIEIDSELIREGDFLQPLGYQCGKELLNLPEPPTAIFVSSDLSAFGVMEAARDQGIRIPQDLSIIGFDDIPQAASMYPALTTVRQPLEEMGERAAHLLLQYIKEKDHPIDRIELPCTLIVRQSCAEVQ